MHRGHHHHHHHDHDFAHGEAPAHPGHNGPAKDAVQWQTPHAHEHHHPEPKAPEPDFDLIEAAFADAFPQAPDPTSFLRMAGVPFVGRDGTGRRLFLLRVETGATTDIGSVTPVLGGGSVRYAPLPSHMTSRRRELAIVYTDGTKTIRLSLGEAKLLKDETLSEAGEAATPS
jgi:hypothetical protein